MSRHAVALAGTFNAPLRFRCADHAAQLAAACKVLPKFLLPALLPRNAAFADIPSWRKRHLGESGCAMPGRDIWEG